MNKSTLYFYAACITIISFLIFRYLPAAKATKYIIGYLFLSLASLILYQGYRVSTDTAFPTFLRSVRIFLRFAAITFGMLITVTFAYLLFHEFDYYPDAITFRLFAAAATIALLVATLEEFVFRGLMLSGLRQVPKLSNHLWFIIALQAILFSLSHYHATRPIQFFVTSFIVGIWLGKITVETGNLWPALGFHFAWDLFFGLLKGSHSANVGNIPGVLDIDRNSPILLSTAFLILPACWLLFRTVNKHIGSSKSRAPGEALT